MMQRLALNPYPPKWTERAVCHTLAFNTFAQCLCVPNCGWAGYEADLLVVTKSMHLIDVEIKLTKADLKADKVKGKWKTYFGRDVRALEYPRRIWKHFVAVPEDLWGDDWLEHCHDVSGVLLVRKWGKDGIARCLRRAKANPTAYTLTNADIVSVSRLASYRMWNALAKLHPC